MPKQFNDEKFGLTVGRLRECLHYDPLTGLWTWLVSNSFRRKAGSVAGDVKPSGYVLIGIDGRRYRAHRLAWLYMTGEWPVGQVDHRDTVRHHNFWANLRLADDQQNQANAILSRNNTSGFKGVYWSRRHQKWHAKINPNRRQVSLGFFDNIGDAAAAYERASLRYFGEFARAA